MDAGRPAEIITPQTPLSRSTAQKGASKHIKSISKGFDISLVFFLCVFLLAWMACNYLLACAGLITVLISNFFD